MKIGGFFLIYQIIMKFNFFIQNILLGFGLAMDAFSVSLANGLNEPKMKKIKTFQIAGVFGLFQFLMSFIGYLTVSYISKSFMAIERHINIIAFNLLLIIGIKMIYEGIFKKDNEKVVKIGFIALMVQGIATSIDALSVGFTATHYIISEAVFATVIIGIITFFTCLVGVLIGKKFGDKLSNKATVIGGLILILIGIKVLI